MANQGKKKKNSSVINNALRDGKISKPSKCQRCGKGGTLQAHHGSDSKPRSVEWLCPSCHGKIHN